MSAPAAAAAGIDVIPVATLRSVIDEVARELQGLPAFAVAERAPVVALGEFDNRSTARLDSRLVLESLRAATIQVSQARVRFRDESAYGYILDERARQSTVPVVGDRRGGVSALAATGAMDGRRMERTLRYEQRAQLDGRMVEVGMFLSGALFQHQEREIARPNHGVTLWQFQFRLTDARSGVILWEKVLATRTEGPMADPPRERPVAGELPRGEAAAASGMPAPGGFLSRLAR
ncbi:MAG: hypothetical protein FJX46_14820 [Alphaproteobacteria bacterium]|nr:hypothetical protein [Alphaproteobacteria bacterium]